MKFTVALVWHRAERPGDEQFCQCATTENPITVKTGMWRRVRHFLHPPTSQWQMIYRLEVERPLLAKYTTSCLLLLLVCFIPSAPSVTDRGLALCVCGHVDAIEEHARLVG